MATKRKRLADPRWARWQVYCGGAPVGKPILAVSEKQAIHIKRNRQTGIVLYGEWSARQASLTLDEAAALAEFDAAPPRSRQCPNCGYYDPSPMADTCPNCGALRYGSGD